jgi:hypothetical protein
LPIAPVLMSYSPLGPGPGFLISNTFLTVSLQVLSTRRVCWTPCSGLGPEISLFTCTCELSPAPFCCSAPVLLPPVRNHYPCWTRAPWVLFASNGYDWYDCYPSWAVGPEGKGKRNACGWNPAPLKAGECRQHSPASFRAPCGARMASKGCAAPVRCPKPLRAYPLLTPT